MKKLFSLSMMFFLCTLISVLAACGANNGNQATSAATPTQTSAPTQVGATATSTQSGNGKNSFVVYTGKGYTISHRPDWKIQSDGSDGVTFSNPSESTTALHVIVQNTHHPE